MNYYLLLLKKMNQHLTNPKLDLSSTVILNWLVKAQGAYSKDSLILEYKLISITHKRYERCSWRCCESERLAHGKANGCPTWLMFAFCDLMFYLKITLGHVDDFSRVCLVPCAGLCFHTVLRVGTKQVQMKHGLRARVSPRWRASAHSSAVTRLVIGTFI